MRHPRSLHRVVTHPPDVGPGRAGPDSLPIRAHPALPRQGAETDRSPCSRPARDAPVRDTPSGAAGRRWDAAAVLGVTLWLTALAIGISLVVAAPSVPLAAVVLLALVALAHPRLADRVLAGMLAVLLLPVMLLIAVCVALTSPGPVVVRGRSHASSSTALRFRTTVTGAAARCPGKELTPVGRVLRALTLDELPRLLDVAVGRAPLLRTHRR